MQNDGVWIPGVEMTDILRLTNFIRGSDATVDLVHLRILQYFGPGLSLEQRDIIGQLAIELRESSTDQLMASSLLLAANGERLPLPANYPESIKNLVVEYRKTRRAIQNEILDDLLPFVQRSGVEAKITHSARRLQKTQTPKFELLEKQFNQLVLAIQQDQETTQKPNFEMAEATSTVDLKSLIALSASQRRLLAATAFSY